jgi:hypothetical protein
VAHLTLQSLVLLGITFVAGALPYLRRASAYLLLFGCVIDFGLGIGLQLRVQGMENDNIPAVFGRFSIANGRPVFTKGAEPLLSRTAWSNWFEKHKYERCVQRDRVMLGHEAPRERNQIGNDGNGCLQEDRIFWYGWYARHGGSLTFLGDHMNGHLGSLHVPQITILVMFCSLLVLVLRDHDGIAARRRS